MNDFKLMVCGFIFSRDMKKLLLIKKRRQTWQKGLLNGVGGRVENETCFQAMVRETHEEAGLEVPMGRWNYSLSMTAQNWKVYFMWATADIRKAEQCTDEEIYIIDTKDLAHHKTIPNLKWIVPLLLDNGISKPVHVRIKTEN